MAARTGVNAITATLGAGVADTFDLSGVMGEILITNHGNVANPIYVRSDGVAAVVAANENAVVLPSQSRRFRAGAAGNPAIFSIISVGAVTVTVETA